MSRVLTQIDPHLPPLRMSPSDSPSTSSSSPSSEFAPSPSKENPKPDRMREWTFPRNPSPPTSLLHGRSTSIAPSNGGTPCSSSPPATTTRHESTLTKDLRHRPNFSLAHPSTPELSISLPSSSSPSQFKQHHSHTPSKLNQSTTTITGSSGGGGARKGQGKSLNDIVYFVVFGGAFLLFSSSLFGVGYKPPLSTTTSTASVDTVREGGSRGALLKHVEIAKGFREEAGSGRIPADVYQSVGDSSGDRGEEFVRSSPDDPSLDDEHVHDVHHPDEHSAIFPHVDHPDLLDDENSRFHKAHQENRPRPARLPPLTHDDDETEGGGRVGRHTHAGHEEEHESLDENDDYLTFDDEEEEEDADDDEHSTAGFHDHSSAHDGDEEEGDDGTLVDDTISISSPTEDELRDSEESLSALEELLLDADESDEADPLTPEEEEAQHLALQHRRPIVGGGDALERLRREREELGRARERWEARMRDGKLEEGEEDEDESWTGSGELRQRNRRMLKRIRR